MGKKKALLAAFAGLAAISVGSCALYTLALQCRSGRKEWEELRKFRYAHRGLHEKPDYPENSLAAFRRAIEHGYGAELDVHLMKDGKLAVIHDASLERTAGAKVEIEDLTAEDLPKYPLEGTGETIPLFEDVLKLFEKGGTPLIVELKAERNNYNELTKATCELLDKYQVKYCVESFDPRCLIWLKKNRPEILRGQLSCSFKPDELPNPAARYALQHLLTNLLTTPDFIAYKWEDRCFAELIMCREFYNVQEVNWTIRDPKTAEEAEKLGNLVIFENFGF